MTWTFSSVRHIAVLTAALPGVVSPAQAVDRWNCGKASWYGEKFAGKPTASGEPFDPGSMTAAHRTLPFGTRITVKTRGSQDQVVVTVNDRGPFARGRIIDLSAAAAARLRMKEIGIKAVCLAVVTAD